jgi:hypothetical protein
LSGPEDGREQLRRLIKRSGHRFINEFQMSHRGDMNIFWRDTDQIENGDTIYGQDTWLIAQDGAP